jgi:hypothetical protein
MDPPRERGRRGEGERASRLLAGSRRDVGPSVAEGLCGFVSAQAPAASSWICRAERLRSASQARAEHGNPSHSPQPLSAVTESEPPIATMVPESFG